MPVILFDIKCSLFTFDFLFEMLKFTNQRVLQWRSEICTPDIRNVPKLTFMCQVFEWTQWYGFLMVGLFEYRTSLVFGSPMNSKDLSSKQLFYSRKLVRQWCINVTSFCMQFEKWGCGLLREAFRGEWECFFCWKREGGKINYNSFTSLVFRCQVFKQWFEYHSKFSWVFKWYLNTGPFGNQTTFDY